MDRRVLPGMLIAGVAMAAALGLTSPSSAAPVPSGKSPATLAAGTTPTTGGAQVGSAPSGAGPAGASVDAGHTLYVEACSSCHGLDGHGSKGYPTLEGVGPAAVDWFISTGRMPLAGKSGQAPRKVPAFSDTQRAQIVAYVSTLVPGGPPIPPADVNAGSIDNGGVLYRTNCAACHGVAGIGGALAHGAFAPSLRKANPLQIAEAMRIGPDNMPVFDQSTLSDRDVNDIVRYVVYLHHPDDRGGAGLGHVGPITEGFVGLLLGLGVLLMVTYWIGDRTGAEV
jgi:ubiquinol-cytochrome c reductase cytochrome c subunit